MIRARTQTVNKLSAFKSFVRRISGVSPPETVKMASSNSEIKSIRELLPDFPNGPLTDYRKKASFDWRKMKLAVEGEDMIRFKNKVWDFLKNNEIFSLSPETLPLDEQRYLAHKRLRVLNTANLMTIEMIISDPRIPAAWIESVYMYDVSMAVKHSLIYQMFANVIRGMGTERHYKFIEGTEASEISGCFALTEVAHGSNARGMRTTATHDVTNKQFIMHSADFEAAKCWAGNLGKCATHAVVYAKLITADGNDQGLHAFVVPIRCPRTLRPYPGVVVGDMGEKIGLNGIDNGFVMFNLYRIPAENLLNRLGDVDEKGNYVTTIKDPSKRFGASLGILSGGRVQIGGMATNQLQKALAVAIRYSAVRKQFGPDDSKEEYPVLEYQQQQFRLLPYLAASYGMRIFCMWLSESHTAFVMNSMMNVKSEGDAHKGVEMHALSSSSKPVIAWLARDGIQVCREACGGHGYLKATGIGEMRNENDANCTYEGENSILIQQTSNWLLSLWKNIQKGEKIESPYGTADFLQNYQKMKSPGTFKSAKEVLEPENILNAYKWLVCYILKQTADKTDRLAKEGKDSFAIRNDSQAYHAATLSSVYAEHAIIKTFHTCALNVEDRNCKEALLKLVSLFGAWCLEKHLATLYMGKYFSDDTGHLLRDGIIELCSVIKTDAVTLIDTISPPDFILNSILGSSDGFAYQNLQASIYSYPGALSRPHWWKDVVNWKTYVPSKI